MIKALMILVFTSGYKGGLSTEIVDYSECIEIKQVVEEVHKQRPFWGQSPLLDYIAVACIKIKGEK